MIELSPNHWPGKPTRLLAVVLDWAGTTVDFGSRAPLEAIFTAFERVGLQLTEDEIRQSMGKAKPEHIRDLLSLQRTADMWKAMHGRPIADADFEVIYKQFLQLQGQYVAERSPLIPGCAEAVRELRRQGLRIGSSTGYSRDLLGAIAARAKQEGYEPDVMLCADDVAPGRPAPWLYYESARRLDVYPMAAILKVDDTPAGIVAGRNAGMWTAAVVASGNEVGRSREAFDRLTDGERAAMLDRARSRLAAAGAHFLIDTIAELPTVVERINQRLAQSGLP